MFPALMLVSFYKLWDPELVAQCCNQSHETMLFGWKDPGRAGIRTPDAIKWQPLHGDPTTHLLYLGAGSAGRQRKTEEPVFNRQTNWTARLRVQALHLTKLFWPFFL